MGRRHRAQRRKARAGAVAAGVVAFTAGQMWGLGGLDFPGDGGSWRFPWWAPPSADAAELGFTAPPSLVVAAEGDPLRSSRGDLAPFSVASTVRAASLPTGFPAPPGAAPGGPGGADLPPAWGVPAGADRPGVAGPVTGPAVSGPPMSGPPMSGPPMSGPPMSGPPMSGPPMSSPPMSGPPMSGPAVVGSVSGPAARAADTATETVEQVTEPATGAVDTALDTLGEVRVSTPPAQVADVNVPSVTVDVPEVSTTDTVEAVTETVDNAVTEPATGAVDTALDTLGEVRVSTPPAR